MAGRTLWTVLLLAGTASAIDNGLGLLPPMGWRSWNCYHRDVSQAKMERVMELMAARNRTVDEKNTSLVDLGYVACGLDDNWQACGKGVNGSFHDGTGEPLINTDLFPDMKAMTDFGHKLGIRVGWYMNNCICSEKKFTDPGYIQKHMEASAAAVAKYGFDGVKLDGCGEFRNLTWWAQLLNATGRHILIENCHWGGTVPGQQTGDGPCTGTTTPSDCPYNFFRSSTDIQSNWKSVFSNLQTTVKFQGDPPLSRPGAWAYPDMLEVGNLASYEEDRSHFGAWCVTSSPLILGLDLADSSRLDRVWDIITNREAIAVNQVWAGHPGRLAKTWSSGSGNTDEIQLWVKPVANGDIAVFVLSNMDPSQSKSVTFTLQDIGAMGPAKIRDIWNKKDIGTVESSFTTDAIKGHDSRFYRLSRA